MKQALLILFGSLSLVSCRKFLQIDPPSNQVTTDAVFNSNQTATAAILGIYVDMMSSQDQYSAGATTLYFGLYADELNHVNFAFVEPFLTNRILPTSHETIESAFWSAAYRHIYAANLALEKLGQSTSLSPDIQNRLAGEAHFIRAFSYFYLVNIFGDIPLITKTDYRVSGISGRTPAGEVYTQIIRDLEQARSLLPESYVGAGRTRPNRLAAQGLLARVQLYVGNWQAAVEAAQEVIGSADYQLEADPANAFLRESREMIWQLLPVQPGVNTWEGFQIVPATPQSPPTFYVNPELVAAFDLSDRRRTWMVQVNYDGQELYYPAKYKVPNNAPAVHEYYGVLRLAEMYLIRAEARVHRDDLDGATQDVQTIQLRAGLNNSLPSDPEGLLDAVERERKLELAFEWGHRFFDLKRTDRLDAVLGTQKPTWTTNARHWPIPENQLLLNASLTQNPGY